MHVDRLLLTTPSYPYPTLPANDSITDATGQRFTKGDDLFTIVSHTHCYANHILAQNVSVPSVVLEYPRWEDFTREVDQGYPLIGISAYPPHLDRVMEMCTYIRRRSPATQILLGSYAAMAFGATYDEATQRRYVDHVVRGEGVEWLRRFLGEPTDRPIRQALMPKAGGAPPYISRFPRGNIGFLVSGLGCIGGCNFCSTTTFFARRRLELLSPSDLIEHMWLYYDHFPEVTQVFVIEEDHFRQPRYLEGLEAAWEERPDVVERLDWFGFGSVDYIGRYAQHHGWEAIAKMGLGTVFIGVESKFAGEHGYEKRDEFDAREIFARLHAMGIRTVGAWICGWDWHDHTNIHEDLNYFISLYPTYQQITRVSPFPGTPLWEELRKVGRVRDVPWEDVHFWNGSQKNVNLEAHETLNFTEHGYDLMYRTWGPSVLRRLDVQLSGYDFCRRAGSPLLRRHKARFHKQQCAQLWCTLAAIDRHAPNGIVRRRARKIADRYRALIGEPTPVMEALSRSIELLATVHKVRQFFDPDNRHPKEEPYKRYLYDKDAGRRAAGDPAIPYRVELSEPTPAAKKEMDRALLVRTVLAAALKTVRLRRSHQSDPEIDDYLVHRIAEGWNGFGF